MRSPRAAVTAVCTQPSINASSVSSRCSAAVCSGVAFGSKTPWVSNCSIAAGSLSDIGLMPRAALLDAAHVDLHAAREGLDGVQQLTGQPRHMAEEPVMRGFAGGQERQDLAARLLQTLRQLLDRLGHAAPRRPCGPSGRPMSVEVSTSLDSVASAWPSCDPKAIPPICDIIDISGPAIALASSGNASAQTVEICSAIGSHSRFQVSSVLSTQSCGVHPTALVVPAGSAVTPSSQVSARCTASEIAADVAAGIGFDEADRVGREPSSQVVVDRPGCLPGAHRRTGAAEHLAELREELPEIADVELAAHAERVLAALAVAGLGVLAVLVAVRVVPGGKAERQVSHIVNGTHHCAAAGTSASRSGERATGPYCWRREQADSDAAWLRCCRSSRSAALLGVVTVPYVSLGPGPTFNTLGEVDGKEVVDIEGTQVFPASGHLNMTTVAQRDQLTLGQAVALWVSGREQLVPHDLVYPPDKSRDEVDKDNTAEFAASEDKAKYAALGYLKYAPALTVEVVNDGGPSHGKLAAGDAIDKVNGTPITGVDQFQDLLKKTKPGENIVVDLPAQGHAARGRRRSRSARTRTATTVTSGWLFVTRRGRLSRSPSTSPNVGGPSAGLMFALAVDRQAHHRGSDGLEVRRRHRHHRQPPARSARSAGITHKMLAAHEAGATVFLVPADNCAEARTGNEDGLELVRVDTLGQAVDALNLLSAGGEPPRC